MIPGSTSKLKYTIIATLIVAFLVTPTLLVGAGCGDEEEELEAAVDEILEDVDASFNASYVVKVTDMVFPYIHPDDLYGPQAGNQWAKVTVSVENTADPEGYHPMVAGFMDFELEASDGQMYSAVLPTIENEFGASRSPEPGQTETGAMVFEIPEGTTPVALWESIGGEAQEIDLP